MAETSIAKVYMNLKDTEEDLAALPGVSFPAAMPPDIDGNNGWDTAGTYRNLHMESDGCGQLKPNKDTP
ncbi:hypothetical protein CYMTET_55816 [Cymbomonas tetramitiformis]|uniref:Uncharacterized protein n=1 Tax=Cymbomonas tetramitiformis TaxID=36881 RepID=A0AAE0BCJ9_9CHLO|nr:hypothetical protein CYMTET_55816 [Cymbomonas tetramitiformis]